MGDITKLPENGAYTIMKGSTGASEDNIWTVNNPKGNCTCPAFQASHTLQTHVHNFPPLSFCMELARPSEIPH